MDVTLQPTWAGAAVSAIAIAGGAPWFDDGLRALRLRRGLAGLTPASLEERPSGMVQVQGRVTLDSPLFGPLSARPCAGFILDVTAGRGRAARIEEQRPFRLVSGDVSARVFAGSGCWELAVTERREIAPGEPLSQRLEELFSRSPEARWLRSSNTPLALSERALLAGEVGHVIGQARAARPFEWPAALELSATGTDDATRLEVASGEPRRGVRPVVGVEPDLWIEGAGPEGFVRVSDQPIDARRHAPSPARVLGAALGPLLSLSGLLHLAYIADAWRAGART